MTKKKQVTQSTDNFLFAVGLGRVNGEARVVVVSHTANPTANYFMSTNAARVFGDQLLALADVVDAAQVAA